MQKKIFSLLATILIGGISDSADAMKQKISPVVFRKKTAEIDVQVTKTLIQALLFYTATFLYSRVTDCLPPYYSPILFNTIKNNQNSLFTQLYKNYCENFEGKKPVHRNRDGRTLLEYAIERDNRRIVAEILESWFIYFYLFDPRPDNAKNNIFHRILSLITETNEMFIVKSITRLVDCPAHKQIDITTKNSLGTSPLDIAFKKRLNTLLVKLVPKYAKLCNNEIAFVIENICAAQKYRIWDLCAKLLKKYPNVIENPKIYQYGDKNRFYRELMYRGIDPNTLRPPNSTTDGILKKYRREYRPGITGSLHYFWGNLAIFAVGPHRPDLTVSFGKI